MDNSGFIPLDWNEVPLKEMKERAKEILSVAQDASYYTSFLNSGSAKRID